MGEREPGLSFSAVARRMGGSTTVVTHYFHTRQQLLDALLEDLAHWRRGAARPALVADWWALVLPVS